MAGQNVRAAPLDQSEPIETASLDELRALQLKRLKQTIARAALVPQYRKKFAAAGIAPEDLKRFDDLKALPFTTKDDFRQNYPFGMFAVSVSDVVRIHASSGTTGKPTVVGYTRGDIELWSALMARSIRAAPAIRCISPMAMGCSPAGSDSTTAPNISAARSFRSAADLPSGRFS